VPSGVARFIYLYSFKRGDAWAGRERAACWCRQKNGGRTVALGWRAGMTQAAKRV